jgi:hypothetical protein
MPNKNINDFDATASALTGTERIEILQGGINKKGAVSLLATYLASASHWRGAYDASVDAYPSTGGSGVSGDIMGGDEWYVSVEGELTVPGSGTITVYPGAIIKALVNTPGTTPGNWKVIQ